MRKVVLTIALSNMARIFSSDSPDTPEISSVDVTFRSGSDNSLKFRNYKAFCKIINDKFRKVILTPAIA